MTMMRIRRVVLSMLSSLEVYGETKRAATHRRLAAPSTQIQPAMLEGTDLTRTRQERSPSRHSAKRKRAGGGRAAQVMLPARRG